MCTLTTILWRPVRHSIVVTVHNNSHIEHNSPNRHRQSYGVHLPLHHGTAGNSHYVRDVFLSPKYTRLLVSITTTKTPPLSSETGDAVRLNSQETDHAALGLERNIFSDCTSGLDGETGDIALTPPVSLEQDVSLSLIHI